MSIQFNFFENIMRSAAYARIEEKAGEKNIKKISLIQVITNLVDTILTNLSTSYANRRVKIINEVMKEHANRHYPVVRTANDILKPVLNPSSNGQLSGTDIPPENKEDNKPVDVPGDKAEEKKVEGNKAEEKKVEEKKVEENKAEEKKVEENKAEENKVEEKKVEENKAEEKKVEENKAEEKKAEKSLKTYVDDSGIAFFNHRKGFPNPSARNCGYNSLSVIFAHTGHSLPPIHPENKDLYEKEGGGNPENFENVLRQGIKDREKQKEEIFLQLEVAQNQVKILQSAYREIQENLTNSENELNELNKARDISIQAKKKERQEALQNLSTQLIELRRAKTAAENAGEDTWEIECQINQLRDQVSIKRREVNQTPPTEFDEAIRLKEVQIRQQKKEQDDKKAEEQNASRISYNRINEKGQIEREIADWQTALTNQDKLLKCAETLTILRGERDGNLTEQDARNLHDIAQTIDTMQGVRLYNGPQDIRNDSHNGKLCPKLREALDDPNWRALRVGGHGHWWTYIRNVDGTVDEVNDSQVYRKRMTVDQLFDKYSKPDEWSRTQITFYHGIQS